MLVDLLAVDKGYMCLRLRDEELNMWGVWTLGKVAMYFSLIRPDNSEVVVWVQDTIGHRSKKSTFDYNPREHGCDVAHNNCKTMEDPEAFPDYSIVLGFKILLKDSFTKMVKR